MERGLVISPPYESIEGGLRYSSPVINPTKLRKYLTYWDKIALTDVIQRRVQPGSDNDPYQMVIGVKVNDLPNRNEDIGFAVDNGLLKIVGYDASYKNRWTDSDLLRYFCKAQQEITERLNRKKGIYWSIGQSVKNLQLPDESSEKRKVIYTTLENSLPSPKEDVKLQEIMGFKERYSRKLYAFRSEYDEMYQQILSAPNQKLKLHNTVKRIEGALRDVRDAMEKDKIEFTQTSQKILWKVPVEVVKAFGAAEAVGFPVELSALTGALQAAFTMNKETQPQPKDLPEKVKDYAYPGHVEQELS